MAAPAYFNKPLGTCYALRYPDLLAGFCGGVPSRCDFAGLLDHWNTHGVELARRRRQRVLMAEVEQNVTRK